jgi:hypothetical protein
MFNLIATLIVAIWLTVAPHRDKVTLSLHIPQSPENRGFVVVVSNADGEQIKRTERDLDGANESPLQVIDYRELPNGEYMANAVLVTTNGVKKATSMPFLISY